MYFEEKAESVQKSTLHMDNTASPGVHGLYTGVHHQEAEKNQLMIKYSGMISQWWRKDNKFVGKVIM